MLRGFAFVSVAVCALKVFAGEVSIAPEPGAAIPAFTLSDIHRRPRSLEDFNDMKATVLFFIGTECPLANRCLPSLFALHQEYSQKGVQFLAINSNIQDSFVEVSAHAQERNIPFPVLKDFDHAVADACGAKRTPEVFLLDADRVIRYHGRLDDQNEVGFQRDKPTRRDLREALDELLEGKPVSTPSTPVTGCNIGRGTRPRVEGSVTYAKEVSRIIQNRCQNCHRPGQIGPMALTTFDDVKAWAETIHEVVLEERMPPWHADPRFGKFSNDRSLPRSEAMTLLAWIEAGCPEGDPRDMPEPKVFPDGWSIGKPDVVYSMSEEFQVPPAGVLPYQRILIDPKLSEDVWVQAAECQPGNRSVVHHIVVYIQEPGMEIFARDGTTTILVGWAPGDMPAVFAEGIARRVVAGSKLVFEVHYTPNGKEERDRSSVGLIFAKKPPERAVQTNILANMLLRIPPGAPNHPGQHEYTFPRDARLLSFMPHMHLRGVGAAYLATYPDGRTETLLSVPDYDFNWQSVYRFAEPPLIPAGTKLTWTARWDNSADNPRNPDPTKEVRWGLQTWEEMQNGWMDLVWEVPAKEP